jgi:hypothetical protein
LGEARVKNCPFDGVACSWKCHDLGDYFALGDTAVDSAGELTTLNLLKYGIKIIHSELQRRNG